MSRKMVVELPDGTRQMLEQVPADHELHLQERLKLYPELLPLEELGLRVPRSSSGASQAWTRAESISSSSATAVI
jgi:hypothetical protein